jgi:DNA-binding beta-propeller fold protein YncE
LDGLFLREWPIAGWTSQSVSNKPYLTTDSDGRVFVSDPEGARVLVFDSQGEPLAVLGGLNSTLYDLPSGIVVDSSDHLWVSDAANQRVLRFPALQLDQPDEAP